MAQNSNKEILEKLDTGELYARYVERVVLESAYFKGYRYITRTRTEYRGLWTVETRAFRDKPIRQNKEWIAEKGLHKTLSMNAKEYTFLGEDQEEPLEIRKLLDIICKHTR